MKKSLIAIAFTTLFTTSAFAGDDNWSGKTKDAWIDGKAEATLLFNGNLNSFDINTDVDNGVVSLTGKVDNTVERELAEELILGIDGVSKVNNKLVVLQEASDEESEVAATFTDAKIVTVITSRLIFDSQISGTDIDVDVDDRKVVLNGTVASETERDLVIAIAENTKDVEQVTDKLVTESE